MALPRIAAMTLLLTVFALVPSVASAADFDPALLQAMRARLVGPATMSGRVAAIDVSAHDENVMFVGASTGGVWRSSDGGLSWQSVGDDLAVPSVGAVAIHPRHPNTVWVGTGEGNPRNSSGQGAGVYRSNDGGDTWSRVGLEGSRAITRIICDPNDAMTAWVAAMGDPWRDSTERGVYKTTDGGKSWTRTLFIGASVGCADLVVDPSDPSKLIAAMWDFRREPWFFRSGGPGSGIFISYDAGETWNRKTSLDGLPDGDLGRIGLAIAPSEPNVVYAIVEAKKNAIYRSTDGGETWRERGSGQNIGNRPFYYADLRVDPQDATRVYSLWSQVSVSEDGGQDFRVLINWNRAHPDHHALWISPRDPRFMINGNDGGLAITRDRGKSWRFVRNLPLAQFYHVRVDNELPYNIYGGLQDNGSWRGPNTVWRGGGIRNFDWQEVCFGDGFDTAPHPKDSQIGYAMSQEGYLVRWDLRDMSRRGIQPIGPSDGTAPESIRITANVPGKDADAIEAEVVETMEELLGELDSVEGMESRTKSEQAIVEVMPKDGADLDMVELSESLSVLAELGVEELNLSATAFAPNVTPLRFNWNAGFEQDPFDADTIYFGSQFVHRSTDRGESWSIVSDDLTTNDPRFQKQNESGGLTPDVTGAENFTSIVSISASPVEAGVLWVGTDDGRLHVTRDSGQTWICLDGKIPARVPANTWIPRIEASRHDAGTAFVCFDDHRRGNWTPYLVRFSDYGDRVRDLSNDRGIDGYVLSVVQDHVDPKLLFCGTEVGLYFSTNGGRTWLKYRHGVPTASCMDLAIQERESDLIVATHGRAVFVIDNYAPLRGLSEETSHETLRVSPVVDAVLYGRGRAAGSRFPGQGEFRGESERYGALISLWVGESDLPHPDRRHPSRIGKKLDSFTDRTASIRILDSEGNIVRTLKPKMFRGLNRVSWGLRRRSSLATGKEKSEPTSTRVAPGTYTAEIEFRGETATVEIAVLADPRVPFDEANYDERLGWIDRAAQIDKDFEELSKRIANVSKDLEALSTLFGKQAKAFRTENEDFGKTLESVKKESKSLSKRFRDRSSSKGYAPPKDDIASKVRGLRWSVGGHRLAPTEAQRVRVERARQILDAFIERFDSFVTEEVEPLEGLADELDFEFFPEREEEEEEEDNAARL